MHRICQFMHENHENSSKFNPFYASSNTQVYLKIGRVFSIILNKKQTCRHQIFNYICRVLMNKLSSGQGEIPDRR